MDGLLVIVGLSCCLQEVMTQVFAAGQDGNGSGMDSQRLRQLVRQAAQGRQVSLHSGNPPVHFGISPTQASRGPAYRLAPPGELVLAAACKSEVLCAVQAGEPEEGAGNGAAAMPAEFARQRSQRQRAENELLQELRRLARQQAEASTEDES